MHRIFLNFLHYFLGLLLLDHIIILCLTIVELPNCFYIDAIHLFLPTYSVWTCMYFLQILTNTWYFSFLMWYFFMCSLVIVNSLKNCLPIFFNLCYFPIELRCFHCCLIQIFVCSIHLVFLMSTTYIFLYSMHLLLMFSSSHLMFKKTVV